MVDHLTSLLYVLLPWNWKTESEDVSIFAGSRDQPISSGSNRFAAIAGRTGFAQDSSLEGTVRCELVSAGGPTPPIKGQFHRRSDEFLESIKKGVETPAENKNNFPQF